MQPTIAAGLWVRQDAELVEERLHARGGFSDLVEHDTGLGVEIDPQFVGVPGIFHAKRPEVEPQTAQVHGPNDVSQVRDDERPRCRAVRRRDLDCLEPLRRALGHTLLEKRIPERSVGKPLQHRGAAACRKQDRLRDGEVITDDIQLARPETGEEDLAGVRDLDAAARHLNGPAGGSAVWARHTDRLTRHSATPVPLSVARRLPG